MSKPFPDTLSVGETADLLNISTQEVRKMCRNGAIEATQCVSGSGKWIIQSEQFFNSSNREVYLKKIAEQKKASLEIVTTLLDILKDK